MRAVFIAISILSTMLDAIQINHELGISRHSMLTRHALKCAHTLLRKRDELNKITNGLFYHLTLPERIQKNDITSHHIQHETISFFFFFPLRYSLGTYNFFYYQEYSENSLHI